MVFLFSMRRFTCQEQVKAGLLKTNKQKTKQKAKKKKKKKKEFEALSANPVINVRKLAGKFNVTHTTEQRKRIGKVSVVRKKNPAKVCCLL